MAKTPYADLSKALQALVANNPTVADQLLRGSTLAELFTFQAQLDELSGMVETIIREKGGRHCRD